MNLRFPTAFAALGCVLLASCYPYDESKDKRHAPPQQVQKPLTPAEQQKLKEQRDHLKETDNLVQKDLPKDPAPQLPPPTPTHDGETVKPPTEVKHTDYPVASKVPGKEGFVFSPFNNKLISVRDQNDNLLPSGTLVADPTYPESAKKYFRVP